MRLSSAALGTVLAIALVACGDGGDERTVLHFTTWKPNQPAAWDVAIGRFEETHPGVEVRRHVGPHSSTAFHDLLTQKLKNRDRELDVFLMDVIWPAEFAAAGWARELSAELPPEERAKFLPGSIEANTWRGGLYGVPLYVDAGLLYYRRDLLEARGLQPPATWGELVDQARAIVAAERGSHPGLVGYVGQFKQYEGLVCNMVEIVASGGGSLVDAATRRGAISNPSTLAAIRWTREELIGEVAPRAVLTYEEPESLAVFVQGNAVFLRSWPYAWEIASDPTRSRVAGLVGLTVLPHFPGHDSVSTLGGWQYGISSASRRPDLAWSFVAFMTSEGMQRHFAIEASLAPTRSALYDDPEVLARNPQLAEQGRAFRRAVPRPVTPLYPAVSAVLQRTLSAMLVNSSSDLGEAARQADAEIARYLEMAPPDAQ